CDLALVIPGDLLVVEAIESAPIVLALLENSVPAKACLCAFKDQELKEHAVIVNRAPPFVVVISDRELIARPRATSLFGGFNVLGAHRLASEVDVFNIVDGMPEEDGRHAAKLVDGIRHKEAERRTGVDAFCPPLVFV